MEFLDGVFTHLALVNNPRYERANIVFNSKTVVENGGNGSGNFGHAGRPGQVGGSLSATFYNYETKTIELSGNELGTIDENIRKNAETYYKNNFQGNKFKNDKLGEVLFSNPGLRKLKTNSADIDRLKAIPALKDIVEYGEYQGAEDISHPRMDGIIKFHRINHNVKVGDNEPQKMSILIGEDRNGNRFYNLNHQTYTIKNSSQVERAKGVADEELSINIITDNQTDFNPNEKESEDMNIKNWNEADHPRNEQGKFTEKGGSKAKSFRERQQEDIDSLELVELGKFPTKFTSKYPKGFIGESYKKENGYKNSMQRVTDKLKELDEFDLGNWLLDKDLISEKHLDEIYDDEDKLHQFIYDIFQDYDIADDIKESLFKRKNFDKEQKEYYNKASNSKENDMALLEELKKLITKVENDKGDDNMEIENEKVDKREIIRDIMAIAAKENDDFKGGDKKR